MLAVSINSSEFCLIKLSPINWQTEQSKNSKINLSLNVLDCLCYAQYMYICMYI